MKLYKLMLLFALCLGLSFSTNAKLFAQDDDDDDDDDQQQQQMEEMDEEEWQRQMDDYNAQKTQLQSRLAALNTEIDGLKATSTTRDRELDQCESDMYTLVGTTKTGVADFRRKFEETEKKINGKTGTPADARKSYFDEITNDRARCLPEFADRYASMRKKLADWEGIKPVEGTYTVVKGDCLWKISNMKYGSPYFWPAIWDANKNGVVNADQLTNSRHKKITNPNLIYPGQVLRIPTLTDAQKKEAEMKSKRYRKTRKTTTTTTTETKTDVKKDEKKDVKKDVKK
jgi:nucleoid-associated protein YgaU